MIRFYHAGRTEKIAGIDNTFVLARYEGIIAQAIKEIKYRGTFAISQELAEMFPKLNFSFDYLVPVPLAPKRLVERGFNQAEKLARALKLAPVANTLTRTRETKPQFDLKISGRRQNVENAFATKYDCSGFRVCLVDDVATTGSTLSECAKVLRKAGARKVYAICIARGN